MGVLGENDRAMKKTTCSASRRSEIQWTSGNCLNPRWL
jgi:hypothetical protein